MIESNSFQVHMRLSMAAAILACAGCQHLPAPPPTGPPRAGAETALDRYVARPDASYSWHVAQTNSAAGTTVYTIDLTSQRWLTTNEVNQPLWKHWLVLVKPAKVAHSTALLFISGGNNKDAKLPKPNAE